MKEGLRETARPAGSRDVVIAEKEIHPLDTSRRNVRRSTTPASPIMVHLLATQHLTKGSTSFSRVVQLPELLFHNGYLVIP